jgi:hypothetical protein
MLPAGYLTDYDRQQLLEPCRYWTKHLRDDDVLVICCQILDAFDDWKLRQADTLGMITRALFPTGLLGAVGWTSAEMSSGRVKLEHIDSLEPWQCAGPFIHDDIDLAFKLWLNQDTAFALPLQRFGLERVLSAIGLWSTGAEQSSLIRLNEFLVQALGNELDSINGLAKELYDGHKVRDLEERKRARTASNASRVRRAEKLKEAKQTFWSAAEAYAFDHPVADQDAIVDHLLTRKLTTKSGQVLVRARGTIKRYIAKAMEAGRERSAREAVNEASEYSTIWSSKARIPDHKDG